MRRNTHTSREMAAAPAEILDEFARVSDRFQTEFDLDIAPETPRINAYFDKHHLRKSPTIIVPHTAEGFAAASAIASETKLPIPFVCKKFDSETNFEVADGQIVAFSVPAYKINVIVDLRQQLTDLFGENFAQRTLSSTRAHEIAHSVFHSDTEIVVENNGQNHPQSVYEVYPLSGMKHPISRPIGDYTYKPMWAEEAFATYVSGNVFKDDILSGAGHDSQYDAFGPETFWVDEHYLIHDDAYPDLPGAIGGAVAGQTLEILDHEIPGTIQAMFSIARGEANPEEFRNNLKRKVGEHLFRMMFTNQPHTTWSSIYSEVERLWLDDVDSDQS